MRLSAVVGLLVALLGGCGAWIDGVHVTRRARIAGTLEVEAQAEVQASGGLVIVEQAPGEGFVVEPTAKVGFGERAASATNAGVTVAGGASASGPTVVVSASSGRASMGGGRVEAGAVTVDGAASAPRGRGAAGASASGATVGAAADASATIDAPARASGSGGASVDAAAGASGEVEIALEARASVPREGVWALDGEATAITALTGPGVQVDGVRVGLDELEALADLEIAPGPSAELATDAAIDAWAELEHASLPRAGGETHVVVRVRANPQLRAPRGRLRVHLVIDRSSSMQRSWPRVLAAARALIARLHADDELQIVAYGTDAVEALPITRVGDGSRATAALARISVGGGTNIEAGLTRAYDAAAGGDARSLVILLSDGVPTRGAFEPAELGALAAQARAGGATTSVIGLGTEFDARLLRAVASRGHGGYHVSASLDALADGLIAELEAHARMAARALRVRVSLGEGIELVEMADGHAERVDGGVLLETPHLDAGETRRLVLRVRVPAGARARDVAQVSLDYRSGLDGRVVHASRALEVSFGARAVVRSAAAGAGVLDASLAGALDAAGRAIVEGRALDAKRALEAHATLAEGRVEHRRNETVRTRVRVVRRLASAVHALLPGASHPQRRQVGHAFGALAVRFAR